MSTCHDDFQVLCALAASGDLTKTEHAALREHLKNCISCQSRLVEMRGLAAPLLLAQELKTPGKQLRKGMQERFTERAIREGIPLRPRSQGVGVPALGMVTIVLAALLVTVMLQHSPTMKSVVDTGVADSARVSAPFHNSNSIASSPAPARIRRVRRDRKLSSAVSPIAKPGLLVIEPAALSGHQFIFTLASRNLGMPEVVPSLTFAHRAQGLSLDITSEVFRHNAPHLLAESEHGASGSIHVRSNLASQSLDLDTYRNTSRANFETNGFELIHNVVPEMSGQERSQ
jgi:hypothetical protein